MERHYKIHSAKYYCYGGESRKRKLESLKSARKQQTSMFECNESEEITKTSYKVSHLLACNMKPYSDGEIMKQAIVIFAEECCSASIQLKAKKLLLSNDTVTRRIECVSNDQRDHSFFTRQKILFTTRSHLIPQKTSPIQSNSLYLSGELCQTLRFTRNFSLCDPFTWLNERNGYIS